MLKKFAPLLAIVILGSLVLAAEDGGDKKKSWDKAPEMKIESEQDIHRHDQDQ